jgi:hypothetical protein
MTDFIGSTGSPLNDPATIAIISVMLTSIAAYLVNMQIEAEKIEIFYLEVKDKLIAN